MPSRIDRGCDSGPVADIRHRRRDELAAEGDHDAWEEIYRGVYPRLRAFAARRVDDLAIEDIVSETMTRAVGSIVRYRSGGPGVEAWIFGIARRVIADHYRRLGRERRRRDRGAIAPVAPDDAAVVSDEHARIRIAFAGLSPNDRELLELRFVAGLSPEATAVALGKRPGAVRTAQTRALARLRHLMERDS